MFRKTEVREGLQFTSESVPGKGRGKVCFGLTDEPRPNTPELRGLKVYLQGGQIEDFVEWFNLLFQQPLHPRC